MEPVYMLENRYSYLVGSYRSPLSASYVVQDAEGEFEQNLQDLYLKGQEHLHHEEPAPGARERVHDAGIPAAGSFASTRTSYWARRRR